MDHVDLGAHHILTGDHVRIGACSPNVGEQHRPVIGKGIRRVSGPLNDPFAGTALVDGTRRIKLDPDY